MPIVVADVGLLGLSALAPREWTLRFYDSRHLTPDQLADAQALLVRSTVQVDPANLPDSVEFIGTATIGTDHLPLPALTARQIEVVSAPGCNAFAVTDYVLATLYEWAETRGRALHSLTVGVIGVGHVGRLLIERLTALGIQTLGTDRPRFEAGTYPEHQPLDKVLAQADVLSIHVPLHHHPVYGTAPLWSPEYWEKVAPDALIINAARGGLFSESDWLNFPGDLALDVFPGEPDISEALVGRCWRISPHIAGHSAEGKWRGTRQIVSALARRWGHAVKPVDMAALCEETAGPSPSESDPWLRVLAACPLAETDQRLRQALSGVSGDARRAAFDQVRRAYRLRRESETVN